MNAEPIWHPTAEISHIYLRHTLVLSATATGQLRCASTGPYQIFVNGQLLGRGQGPTLTGVPVWENFDLSPALGPGDNTLLILVAAGPGAPPWFAAEGQVDDRSFCTSPLWQVLRADAWETTSHLALNNSAGWAEGRIHPTAWTDPVPVQPLQAPRSWPEQAHLETEVFAQAVVAFGEVDAAAPLSAAPSLGPMDSAKCVRREAVLRQGRAQTLVQTNEPARAVFLRLDFGRLVRGFLRLRLRAPAGAVLDIGFALTPDQLDQTQRYVAADGHQDWDDIELRSCRYIVLRLSGCSEPAEIDSVSLIERQFVPAAHSAVELPAPRDRIWAIGRQTLSAARQENYVLEKGPADWLRAVALARNDYCQTSRTTTAAATLAGTPPPTGGTPASMAHALFLADYYRYSGDAALATQLLASALENLAAAPSIEDWHETAFAALNIGALEATARLCGWLAHKDQRNRLTQRADQLKKNLADNWSASVGLFVDADGQPRQLGNGLVLFFGLAQAAQRKPLLENLRSAQAAPPADLLEAYFVAAGLLASGDGQRALAYIDLHWGRLTQRQGQLWGEKSASSLTTIEPGPDHIIANCLFGVGPAVPGYQVLEIRPQQADQNHATATLLTSRGPVGAEWFLDGSTQRFRLSIQLPTEAESHIFAPRLGMRFPTVALNGETVWRNEKVYPNSLVHEVISEADYLGLVLKSSGKFEIVVD